MDLSSDSFMNVFHGGLETVGIASIISAVVFTAVFIGGIYAWKYVNRDTKDPFKEW